MITPTNRIKFERHGVNRSKFVLICLLILIPSVVFVFIFAFKTPSPNDSNADVDTFFTSADLKVLWRGQDYRRINELCKSRLEGAPFDTSAILYSGLSSYYIAMSLRDSDEKKVFLLKSINDLQKILIILPQRNNSDIKYILGKAFYNLGYYYEQESFAMMLEAQKDGYVSYDMYEYLGLLSSAFNKYLDALDYFNKSLSITDRYIVHLAIANTYDLMGNSDDALKVIDKMVLSCKDNTILEKAYLKKADIYLRQGNLDYAHKNYTKVLEVNSVSADAYFYLGEIESIKGDGIKARALWRQAYIINQKHSGAINRLSS